MTGPVRAVVNSTQILTFTVALDFVNPDLVFSAFLPELAGVATLCTARVVGAGSDWESLRSTPHHTRYQPSFHHFPYRLGNQRLTLPIGRHANSLARTLPTFHSHYSSLTVQLTLHLLALHDLVGLFSPEILSVPFHSRQMLFCQLPIVILEAET